MRRISSAALVAAVGIVLTAIIPSAAFAGQVQAPSAQAPRASVSGLAFPASLPKNLPSAKRVAAGDRAAQGYGDCPWGKACLFEGYWGTGWRWEAPTCGGWELSGGLWNQASSAALHGNAMALLNYDPLRGEWFQIGRKLVAWEATNFGTDADDQVDGVFVYCP
jgi:hypothetical protein